MRKLLFVVCLMVLVKPAFALDSDYLEKPFIDEEFETYDVEIKKVRSECFEKAKTVKDRLECGNDIKEKYKAEGKLRGTNEYCHAHYRKYDYKGLQQLRRKLHDAKKKARFNPGRGKKLPGEITKNDFDIELGWIDIRLLEMREELSKKKHDAVWNHGKKSQ
jgi:hypothetical protein